MTKQEVLDKLQDHPENSSVWFAIADLLSEYKELMDLQWLYQPGAMHSFGNSVHAKRLHQLEQRFHV